MGYGGAGSSLFVERWSLSCFDQTRLLSGQSPTYSVCKLITFSQEPHSSGVIHNFKGIGCSSTARRHVLHYKTWRSLVCNLTCKLWSTQESTRKDISLSHKPLTAHLLVKSKFHAVALNAFLCSLWTVVVVLLSLWKRNIIYVVFYDVWARVRLRHCGGSGNFKRDASSRDFTGHYSERGAAQWAERDGDTEDEEAMNWRHTRRTSGYLWVCLFTTATFIGQI